MKKEEPDILVMQTGSIEITNINVNAAIMDTSKNIQEYKKEWFKKVEEDSINLLDVAQDALEKNKKLKKVIILKRLPRFDRGTSDLMSIKSELSKFGNAVYDLELTRRGNPENICTVDLDLEGSRHFHEVVFGTPGTQNYDGIHLNGRRSSLHFTYRAIKALKQILPESFDVPTLEAGYTRRPRTKARQGHTKAGRTFPSRNNNSKKKTTYQSYADVASHGPTYNTKRGENLFNHLNC